MMDKFRETIIIAENQEIPRIPDIYKNIFNNLEKENVLSFDFLDIEIIFDQSAARFSYRQAPQSKIKRPTYSSFEGFYVFDKTHVLTACYVVSNNRVGERVRD